LPELQNRLCQYSNNLPDRPLVPIPPIKVQKQLADKIGSILTMRKEALKASEEIALETQSLIS
jgi:hypothetical protein